MLLCLVPNFIGYSVIVKETHACMVYTKFCSHLQHTSLILVAKLENLVRVFNRTQQLISQCSLENSTTGTSLALHYIKYNDQEPMEAKKRIPGTMYTWYVIRIYSTLYVHIIRTTVVPGCMDVYIINSSNNYSSSIIRTGININRKEKKNSSTWYVSL